MPDLARSHAVVIGAGMAGLTAAQAISRHFRKVMIIERDALPAEPAPRSGTPQAQHAHMLLAGGLKALQTLFPGFENDLAEAGAVKIRTGKDIRWERPGFDPFPIRDLGFDIFSMSRPLLEAVTRRRVLETPNIGICMRSRATKLVASRDTMRLEAVRYESEDGPAVTVEAELVVEASGRCGLTLQLLEELSLQKPEETEIGIDQAYASTIVERSIDHDADWLGNIVLPSAPASSRGAFLFPIEKQQWLLSIGGNHGDAPPGDRAAFMDFVKSLRTPTIYDAVRDARPVTDIVRYQLPCSTRRHFERLEAFPAGLLAIGDALCRFNPVFGQGMSVAAQEAVILDRLLAEDVLVERLARDFFAALQDTIATPWGVAVTDFVYPATRGVRPADLAQRLQYGAALTRLAAEDPEVHRLTAEVSQLLKPQAALRDPALAARVMSLI
ncbi:NAD(P)/FAD-dependent oxidoreductase [Bradyrhizobium sp. sBnM-33]|uniref:FAD-dependent oxidoreductase n=1 Tax=Bradyrhizobium sp. sBnM-33 TaxID=2831780 RepID=UPI001BCE27EF|nr:NAD(P)-binding protein [Bradyrhizobium sp. sBnM-33]WOH47964.1 FAD-dependent monooxygenase [Bradyrhizobium sp. sBnM-33]